MKRIVVTIAILLGGAWMAYAQSNTVTTAPCNDPACQAAKFLYFFCDPHTGAMTKKCSADPNNEPGLKMYKKSTPLVFCPNFSAAKWGRIYIKEPSDPLGTRQTEVFVLSNLEQRMREAERRWEFICPPQGPNSEYPYCCVRVEFSRSLMDVAGTEDAEATTWIWPRNGSPLEGHACEYDCQTSRIIINQESEHTRLNENGAPSHFIYTEEQNIASLPRTINGVEYVYSNAYSVFLHEFGHWFGFGHEDDRAVPCQSHFNSIMHTGTASDWNRIRRDLTNDDICMFKKAYCCEQTKSTSAVETGGEAPHLGLSFEALPNPAKSAVVLRFSEPVSLRNVSVRVIDVSGKVMLDVNLERGAREHTLDVSEYANGVYLVEIVTKRSIFSRKVIVQH